MKSVFESLHQKRGDCNCCARLLPCLLELKMLECKRNMNNDAGVEMLSCVMG
ncbi:hypothetical protein HMPREF9163_01843 [Selenomonas sp. oral taxon 138 str. F0429]|nr:hypothetical protein HMPREF9163_01843 [Selenomonas sp. oral taxon 138 str. F0429]